MSVFSDEDLARLKKALDCDNSCSGNVYLPHEDYAALLARLDAAERVADKIFRIRQLLYGLCLDLRQSMIAQKVIDEMKEAEATWKKSAGR